MRGRWAQGIVPRHFTWILKEQLAVCERPGGYGDSHRRVRRQEEIIWLIQNEFDRVVSVIPGPQNLHNYEEMGVPFHHVPFSGPGAGPLSLTRAMATIREETSVARMWPAQGASARAVEPVPQPSSSTSAWGCSSVRVIWSLRS